MTAAWHHPCDRCLRRRPRRALAWGWAFFLGCQVILAALIESWCPEFRDPEYGCKLARLKQSLAEEPGRPLVLVLGSSRAALGFRPDALALSPSGDGVPPLVFNFAIAGAGPLIEHLMLQRLLNEGLRPAVVVVEVMPPLLYQPDAIAEANRFPPQRLGWSDLRLLRPYWSRPEGRCRAWGIDCLAPAYTHRFGIVSTFIPSWLGWDVRQDRWHRTDRWGWLPDPRAAVTAEEYRRGAERSRKEYEPCFQGFRITDNADRALRELLADCRREEIRILLLTMPEGRDFQRRYPPGALHAIATYLADLSQTYRAPWIDARAWADDGAFTDSHHLLASGAAAFSQRFGREALQPFLASVPRSNQACRTDCQSVLPLVGGTGP